MAVLLLLLALGLFLLYVRHKQSHWQRLGVASTPAPFFFGHYFDNLFHNRSLALINDDIYRHFRHSERVAGIYQLLKPHLLIVDPTLVKEITVKYFRNFTDTSFTSMVNARADPLLSRNPFFLSGNEWKERRVAITPAFSPARLKAMFPLISHVCESIVSFLGARQNEPFEARDLCSRFTCDVVSSCGFGADAESFLHDEPQVREHANNVFSTGLRIQYRWMMSMFAPILCRKLNFRLVPRPVQAFFVDLMQHAVDTRKRQGISRQDYLEFIMQKQGSNTEMAADAITFFLDGLDTSSVAIAGALYQLAANPEVQSRLRKELEGLETLDQVLENEYLDWVWAEALRMHTPSGWADRKCTLPVELDVGRDSKLAIRRDDVIFIPIRSIHFDPSVYGSPETFDPERFADGALKKYRDDGLFLAFGNGPRTCIGQRFAGIQAKACIAAVVRAFEISETPCPRDRLVYNQDFMTYYAKELWIKFEKVAT